MRQKHTHTHAHTQCTHVRTHTHTRARAHARTHARTHKPQSLRTKPRYTFLYKISHWSNIGTIADLLWAECCSGMQHGIPGLSVNADVSRREPTGYLHVEAIDVTARWWFSKICAPLRGPEVWIPEYLLHWSIVNWISKWMTDWLVD